VSDAELGRRLGITRQAVEAVAKGRKNISLYRLHEYANALGVRVRELFDE
jgi:transcriptional regulator with XRE-family HTH domain